MEWIVTRLSFILVNETPIKYIQTDNIFAITWDETKNYWHFISHSGFAITSQKFDTEEKALEWLYKQFKKESK